VIRTDSQSALQTLESGTSLARQDILNETLQKLYSIKHLDIRVSFLWVPAHVGVKGNEEADKLSKESLKYHDVIRVHLSKAKTRGLIRTEVKKRCQRIWDNELRGRHLYSIQSNVEVKRTNVNNRKKDKIGNCDKCGYPETANHI